MNNIYYKADLSFVLKTWQIVIDRIYDIDILNIDFQYDFEKKSDFKFEYFTEDMLTLRNLSNKIEIEVGCYGDTPNYTITVIRLTGFSNVSDEEWVNPHDHPVEKATFYRFSDTKEYLIKMMEKYKS